MKRFKYAYEGFCAILKKDQNFLLHILAAIIIIILGLVLSFEAINTSIEFVVDLITTDYHEYAKYAKDIAAFSVVIVSIVSICIGLIVFLPYILEIFKGGM